MTSVFRGPPDQVDRCKFSKFSNCLHLSDFGVLAARALDFFTQVSNNNKPLLANGTPYRRYTGTPKAGRDGTWYLGSYRELRIRL